MQHSAGRVEVRGLTKKYGPVTVVNNLSFVVEPGSVTGFLGPNGAGKTTTLRMLLGLVTPTSGIALINGVAYQQLTQPARVVGAVLDSQSFHPSRTARNHLLVYAAAIGVPDARADQALELVGLSSVRDRPVGKFSLGMRQRMALATALLGDPQVLVLDEPANGLDPEGIAWLRAFLQSYAQAGRTVLVSSHLLAEIEQTVDQVVIISRGQTMYYGSVDNLRASQKSRVLVAPSDISALVAALQAQGIVDLEQLADGRLAVASVDSKTVADIAAKAAVSIYGLQEEKTDLERIFFQLTNGQFAGSPHAYAMPGQPPVAYGPQTGYPPAPAGYQHQPAQPYGYQGAPGYGPPAGYQPQQPTPAQPYQQFGSEK